MEVESKFDSNTLGGGGDGSLLMTGGLLRGVALIGSAMVSLVSVVDTSVGAVFSESSAGSVKISVAVYNISESMCESS
ncbi:unnamed protein product [[Candida] boidinii]|nr:unnamed protein product [[Candida] boidinii]